MDKLIELLQSKGVEVNEDVKQEISSIWPDTDNLFSQEDVDNIVQNRLSRERKSYDKELEELKGKMEDLVEPDQVNKVKDEFVSQLESNKLRRENEKKMYELKLAGATAGVKDLDYFEYLINKNNYIDKLSINDEGAVYTEDTEGNRAGPETIVKNLQSEKPDLFIESTGTKGGSEFSTGNEEVGLTIEDIENMSEDEINDRWDEVQQTMKG